MRARPATLKFKAIIVTDDNRPELLDYIPNPIPRNALLILRGNARNKLYQGNVSSANNPNIAIKNCNMGLHLSEQQLSQHGKLNLRLLSKRFHITAACHSQITTRVIRLKIQKGLQIHSILISPLCKTQSHSLKKPLGLIQTRNIVKHSPVSTYIMGGIDLKNKRKILKSLNNKKIAGLAGAKIVAKLQHYKGRIYG